MKILLSLLGVSAITASTISFTSSNILLGHKSESRDQENNQIDWKMLNQDTSSYFAGLKEVNAFSTNDADGEKLMSALDFAQQKANDYIQRFQAQNLSLDEIIATLSQELPEFGKNYQENLNNSVTRDDNDAGTVSIVSAFSTSESSSTSLERKFKDLKIARAALITTTAVAAVAAAGFWAAVPFTFGITAQWAIAATAISVAVGLVVTVMNVVLIEFDKELSEFNRAGMMASVAAYMAKIGKFAYKYLFSPLITADATVIINSWKIPAVLAVLPVISSILAWIDLFK